MSRAFRVTMSLIRIIMHFAVYFDRQSMFGAVEIENELPKRVLAAEAQTAEALQSQRLPER